MAYDVEGKGELMNFPSATTISPNKSILGRTIRCISHVGSTHEF